MYSQHNFIDWSLFCLILGYINFFLKETESGWSTSYKYILYATNAINFIVSGQLIGFTIMLGYIIFNYYSCLLPSFYLHPFRKKRNH
jgi:hypothetical protein